MFFFPSFSLAHLSSLLCAARYVCVSVMRRVLRCACGQWCGLSSAMHWGVEHHVRTEVNVGGLQICSFLCCSCHLCPAFWESYDDFLTYFLFFSFFVRKKQIFFSCVDFCVQRCGVLRSGFEDPLWTLLEFEWNMSVISKNDFTSWLGDVTLYLWGRYQTFGSQVQANLSTHISRLFHSMLKDSLRLICHQNERLFLSGCILAVSEQYCNWIEGSVELKWKEFKFILKGIELKGIVDVIGS